jgi:flagellar hook-associated protein 1 FlgK
MSLQGILQVGVSGLTASQTGLAVTSHNISNAQTPGYSRQRANFSDLFSLSVKPGQLGEGVQVVDISRLRSAYLDASTRQEIGQQSMYQQVNQDLQNLESVFGSPTNPTLNQGLNAFFNSFQDLSAHPQDISTRQAVYSSGTVLATDFQDANAQIAQLRNGLDSQVNETATSINSILGQVATLNQQIVTTEQNGNKANDLRDQRDQLLDQLSSYMDLTTSEQPNGSVDISVNGQSLVNNYSASTVQVVNAGAPAHPQIQAGGVSLATGGGQLAGFEQSYANIDQTQSALDTLAQTVIAQVNAIHAAPGAAFDLNGVQGVAFFTGTGASDIAVSAAIQNDPTKVVAAGTASPGDNAAAIRMVNLQDLAVYPPGSPSSTLTAAISVLTNQLGLKASQAGGLESAHQETVNSLNAQRQAVSGVNMDEELTNMIQFQRAYQAAARIITSVDESLDTVINHMGRAGL